MLWIGLTGPIGGGKSTVASLLRGLGFPVLDADKVVHGLLAPGGAAEAEVFRTFGGNLRGADGHLDRRALGRVVFADPQKLIQLENLLHPLVRAEVAAQRQKLAAQGCAAAFYDVPLLFEKKMEDQFDYVLVVTASEGVRRARLRARSQWSDLEFDERAARQLAPSEKEVRASYVLRNEGSLEDLKRDLSGALKALQVPLPAAADS